MNSCPCGWQGHANGRCRCTPEQVRRYRGKVSGPILDRLDLLIEVPALAAETLAQPRVTGEPTARVRERVDAARLRQQERQGHSNAALAAENMERHVEASAEAVQLLRQAAERLSLSARSWHRTLKVARTIADLAGSVGVDKPHLAEALQYRRPFTETP
jgi:magnesium chelatase family protein